jgi:hypothetical protein
MLIFKITKGEMLLIPSIYLKYDDDIILRAYATTNGNRESKNTFLIKRAAASAIQANVPPYTKYITIKARKWINGWLYASQTKKIPEYIYELPKNGLIAGSMAAVTIKLIIIGTAVTSPPLINETRYFAIR